MAGFGRGAVCPVLVDVFPEYLVAVLGVAVVAGFAVVATTTTTIVMRKFLAACLPSGRVDMCCAVLR